MIPRQMARLAQQMSEWFPVVSVTGPRQSGKSTLVRATFPDYSYVNLEDPQIRAAAIDDPVGFLKNRASRLIIDEAQYAPDLFSMVQVLSDERGTTGQYILSGSQNFLLMKGIRQSLAGRVGVLKLLPFSYSEALLAKQDLTADAFMLNGGYPRIYDTVIPAQVFYDGYVSTYLERDVADYLDVRSIAKFRTFISLCAARVGSLLNLTALANDAGITYKTAQSWISILESSYILALLKPYSTNLGKRLTKTPKLYFYDTGLLCYLMGIRNAEQLTLHPSLGSIVENAVIAERLKSYLNRGETPSLFFYRDDSKIEVDLVDITDPDRPQLAEIKSSQTYHQKYARHLKKVGDLLGIGPESQSVILRIEGSYRSGETNIVSLSDELRSMG
ncbi:MAG: ATP-binding protein [Atopobiaceae bacterium]|nr:ATP-binding protein [Atopobiaceae bacterium]